MAGFSLTYIYHDCFLLETENAVFIFDFWKDPLSNPENKDYPPLLNEITPGKRFYIIISHHHKDHFSRRVFLWAQKFPEIRYIISMDVFKSVKYMLGDGKHYMGYRPPKESVFILKPGDTYEDDIVKVTAFASTDIGNSYVVEVDGRKFFHAGDLNAWLWIDESSQEEIESSRLQFTKIIWDIKSNFPSLDVAMFPVDSRIGTDYWWGAKYFVSQILTRLFVPMHFELVLSEEDKVPRRIDAGQFKFFARQDFGDYLQLGATRSRYISN